MTEPRTQSGHVEDRGPNGRWIARCAACMAYWPCRTYQAQEAGVVTKAGARIIGEFPSGESIAAIENEVRAALLDELEAAVKGLPSKAMQFTRERAGFEDGVSAVLYLIQQHRETT